MERKEEIIQATLMLASKNGIDNVSMSQIATQLGIKKPSLYNHFRSKDEIVKAMYDYLRTQAKEKLKITDLDYGKLVKDKSLEEVLKLTVQNYYRMSAQNDMLSFYKDLGGKLVAVGSDAHVADNIGYGFDKAAQLIEHFNFKNINE